MKTIGFGIIGAGLWGANHAEVYSRHPYARLEAVCDISEDRGSGNRKAHDN